MHTDPIADILTRIRNASSVRKVELTCPASVAKQEVLRVLKNEGYINNYVAQTSADGHRELRISLNPERGELHIKRISKPGRRLYVKRDKIPNVLSGLGIALISTPKGVMTNKEARREGIGGELICEVW